jgi:flagellin-like hook-associated protein FlgL
MLSDLGAGTYVRGDQLFDVVDAINSALARKNFSQVIYSTHAVNLGGLYATSFWTDGVRWTTEARLGQELEYSHVMLDLEYDQRIDGIMTQLTANLGNANIKLSSTRGASLPNAAGLSDNQIESIERKIYGFVQTTKAVTMVGSAATSFNALALARAINQNSASQFWAMLDKDDDSKLYVFRKEGGDYNDLLACDVYGLDEVSQAARSKFINVENVETGIVTSGGTNFTLGTDAPDAWGVLKPVKSRQTQGSQVWNLSLSGRDVGRQRDLWIAAARELLLPGVNFTGYDDIINGLDRFSFAEVQNASDSPWAGAEIRTQESAQKALASINEAINAKDKVRATLGAFQNRLENTITNLEIQAENLQASESRISDSDVAREVIELTKSSVLVQAAMGMVAQANSLNSLALGLIGR